MISVKVSGFGFPLAYDFLKELGYTEYKKPDVHLIDIFKGLGLIDRNENLCFFIFFLQIPNKLLPLHRF